ncbi:MAG TPA: hypothetical protein VGO64_08575, partial [Candidatus Limnocylindrales bacterium]|nr:hypothetical protein [Candidatus Limnocylindrales bacterium]
MNTPPLRVPVPVVGPRPRLATRLFGIADNASDDEDLRRRKRVGVVAGFVTIFAPLSLPIQGGQLTV